MSNIEMVLTPKVHVDTFVFVAQYLWDQISMLEIEPLLPC